MGERADGARRAMRMIYEGAPPSFALPAAISGRSARGIEWQAAREGWARRSNAGASSRLREQIRTYIDRLAREMEGFGASGEGMPLAEQRARADVIGLMMRNVEKMREILREQERAEEDSRDPDEDMAAVLEKIDRRIEELAREYAAAMGPAESDAG